MGRGARTTRGVFETVGALAGAASLGLQLHLTLGLTLAKGMGFAASVVFFFSFFTILSNALVVLSYAVPLLASGSALGRFFSRPTVRTAVALYIVVVGLVYVIVLRPLWKPEGWQLVADAGLHYLVPALYFLYWVGFVDKAQLRYRDVPRWLIFPLVYCAYALVRGGLVGQYPYPFLEASKIGYLLVGANVAVLVALFWLAGLALVGLGRLISRRPAAGVAPLEQV